METLGIISDSLSKSFGPMGSTTAIVKNIDKNGVNINIEYTKDGHSIVKAIQFLNPIERSVQDMLTELTRYIVKEVGDGTTSAIILCAKVFSTLYDKELGFYKGKSAAYIIKDLKTIISKISKRILEKAKKCTIDDIYNIALISTNGNEEIAGTIKAIYEEFGLDVMIDVGISTEVDNIVKKYDGMTLETGFTDICFVNNKARNSATINNPKIYCFNDPIDTPEMLSFLDTILYNNILRAYQQGSVYEPVPTVIFGKSISPDTSSYFETVVKLMNQYPGQVPLLMVTDIHQEYLYEDIAKMCGAPFIKKYLNPELQQLDIEKGLAPTLETITDFCGSAEMVEADQLKTKIINPVKMFNEDGSYSEGYKSMLSYLETQVEKCKQEDAGIEQISRAKRRLNSFKGNMVDFLVGGVTLADRANLKASVEDAVLNCRSASRDGVGYGANFMAWQVLNEIKNEDSKDADKDGFKVLYLAYEKLLDTLYSSVYPDKSVTIIHYAIKEGCPLNIATNEFDKKVLSSIKSDVIILETIEKILTLMYTCNQYLVQDPLHNSYIANEK